MTSIQPIAAPPFPVAPNLPSRAIDHRAKHPVAKHPVAKHPIALKSEQMRITVRGRLATVCREQVFRNDEARSIEATITFPVPVHATLHHLAARIGERTLLARALRRDRARETYEQAIDDGKTAVLHEELVRGVHVLSVAHIAPGATIVVTHSWIAALAPGGDMPGGNEAWSMRIPVNVGDIYGVSPFTDADDIATSATIVHEADIMVDCGDAVATLGAAQLASGETRRVSLDAPIDLAVRGLASATADGMAADGRLVRVTVQPDPGGDSAIDAAVLVDRSGSMGERLTHAPGAPTKHEGVVAGLREAAAIIRAEDVVELWEFDSTVDRVSGPETPLAIALSALGEPRGGTEIGAAMNAVIGGSRAGDIVLVTDGLSHALDVQALTRSGRRFTVVLVGADSFEPNVGRLAALTGGQIFLVRGGADAAAAVSRAIATLRRTRTPFETGTWPLDTATTAQAGAELVASWSDGKGGGGAEPFATAVGAFAAALVLPRLPAEQAAQVAADHSIVSHLTSLVLVDEAGEVRNEIPAQRKVPLMAVRAAAPSSPVACIDPVAMAAPPMASPSMSPGGGGPRASVSAPAFWIDSSRRRTQTGESLAELARRIDWGADPEALRRGDLTSLDPELAETVVAASHHPMVTALAGPGLSSLVIVIGIMARSCGVWNRPAQRFAKTVLGGLDPAAVATARAVLML